MDFIIAQINGPIYGISATEDDAWDSAQEWLDQEPAPELVPLSDAVDGDLVCVPCSPAVERIVLAYGGDIAYSIASDGIAYRHDELD